MRFAAIIAVSVSVHASLALATSYRPTKVVELNQVVSLNVGGALETWTVSGKLAADGRTLESLTVKSPRNAIEFPAELISDLDRPDLRDLYVSTIGAAVYIHLPYGSVGPDYGEGPCHFRETRFEAEYRIQGGKVAERYFRSQDEGLLELPPGVIPKHPPSPYD